MIVDSNNHIAPLVRSHFPSFYEEEGPQFLSFVEAYYEWMEQQNSPIQFARALPSYRDIDTTLDQFLIHFKNKYLPDIQFDTESNQRLMIKNALQLYRAKGTPRAIDLLFRLVYGVPAEVYYPSANVFTTSSGQWVKPSYLEITHSDNNVQLVGQTITGSISGAEAFVERLVRKSVGGNYIDVIYLSAIDGNFQTGESVLFDNILAPYPAIIGSLTGVAIVAGGELFKVGEQVTIFSATGSQAIGVITAISPVTGIVQFTLIDGGFGYALDSNCIVSNTVMTISNVAANSLTSNTNFVLFETIVQPLAQISYDTLAGGIFSNGQKIESYYANGFVAGNGTVLNVTTTNSTAGQLITTIGRFANGVVTNPNFSSNIAVAGNVITANVSSYADITATGNVMAKSTNVVLTVLPINSNTYQLSEKVFVQNTSGFQIGNGTITSLVGSNVSITGRKGILPLGSTLVGANSGATSNIQNFTTTIGLVDLGGNGSFSKLSNNYLYGLISNTTATMVSNSTGILASFQITSIQFPEQVLLNLDYLHGNNSGNVPYISLRLDGSNGNTGFANGYGFPQNPSIGINGSIFDSLQLNVQTIGVIGTIGNINPGTNYNTNPFVLVYDSAVAGLQLRDYVLTISNTVRSFAIGEVLNQQVIVPNTATINVISANTFRIGELIYQSNGTANVATGVLQLTQIVSNTGYLVVNSVAGAFVNTFQVHGANSSGQANVTAVAIDTYSLAAQGLYKSSANSTTITVKRLSLASFSASGNTLLVGLSSNATATIVSAVADSNTIVIGENANISANVTTANGSVANIDIIQSGYGFIDQQLGSFNSAENPQFNGTVVCNVDSQGTSEGYWRSLGGTTSGTSALFDGDFYQQFSYQVLAKIPLDKYRDVLQRVLHVSGTKMFGKVVFDSNTVIQLAAHVNSFSNSITAVINNYSNSLPLISGQIVNNAGNNVAIVGNNSPGATLTVNTPLYPTIGSLISQNSNSAYGSVQNSVANSTTTIITVKNIRGQFNNTTNTTIFDTQKYNVAEQNAATFSSGQKVYYQQKVLYFAANVHFTNNEVIYQQTQNLQSSNIMFTNTAAGWVVFNNSSSIAITNITGAFQNNRIVVGATSGQTAIINKLYSNNQLLGNCQSANSTVVIINNAQKIAPIANSTIFANAVGNVMLTLISVAANTTGNLITANATITISAMNYCYLTNATGSFTTTIVSSTGSANIISSTIQ